MEARENMGGIFNGSKQNIHFNKIRDQSEFTTREGCVGRICVPPIQFETGFGKTPAAIIGCNIQYWDLTMTTPLWQTVRLQLCLTMMKAFSMSQLSLLSTHRKNPEPRCWEAGTLWYNLIPSQWRPLNPVHSGQAMLIFDAMWCRCHKVMVMPFGVTSQYIRCWVTYANHNTLTTQNILCYVVLSMKPISSWLLKFSTATKAHLHLCEKEAGK